MSTFEHFLTERKYIKNVSPATVQWYSDVFKEFAGIETSSAQALRQSVMQRVNELLERGIKPISVRSWLTGIRAYGYRFHEEGLLKEKPCIEMLRCEQKIIPTFSPEQIRRVIHCKPIGRNESRVHTMAVTALDTGLRLQELLSLTRQDVDLDHLVLRITRKGQQTSTRTSEH